MLLPRKKIWTLLLLVLAIVSTSVAQDYEDDDSEEPTARVARISFVEGESKIKRIDGEEWESIIDNLPVVEGDLIETRSDSRIEIQLDRYSFLRLGEDSVLKLTFLAEDGIALSLSKGSLVVTLIRFEKKDTYFEIDAPRSTIAIQKNGTYRIDAGNEYNKEVRVAVRDEGEARVYSTDSGFLLKDGRTARLFLDGNFAGEWETSRNSNFVDDFDEWSKDRNAMIAASFDDDDDRDYYDADIYGADDLDQYGDWVYISDYGHVWRPSSRSLATYLNWSLYRYGQ
ncbi:MAG: FecR family protein, partial [Acidobacteriota bacterium]|nr:FecR family protein [Acidobacteriota bacterium]